MSKNPLLLIHDTVKFSLWLTKVASQQRVAIASALLNTPEIIIADEPTENIYPQTSLEIMEVMQKQTS